MMTCRSSKEFKMWSKGKKSGVKKHRRDALVESSTYIIFMDNLPEYNKLYFKIGRSINVMERLRQLRTGNPFIKTILIQDFDCEYFLHQHLRKYRVQKEWFCIDTEKTPADVAYNYIKPLLIEFLK